MGTIAIDFVPEPEADVPLPGSGTWIFEAESDGRRFVCRVSPGEPECTNGMNIIGRHLDIDLGASSFELTVRYVDIEGVETVRVHEEIEPEYALAEGEAICGMCPVAELELALPVDGLVVEGG